MGIFFFLKSKCLDKLPQDCLFFSGVVDEIHLEKFCCTANTITALDYVIKSLIKYNGNIIGEVTLRLKMLHRSDLTKLTVYVCEYARTMQCG